ncbi:carboxylate-amine ligase [Yinghuangia seranimata]|uniref:carboxylate-amine ligase n=1 Tax=Yinghuangia seranimata TaxID=408067 RepID=UPI00248CEC98|nr:glutamate--cysteine ligase [Yinghuangia seranimata]MDI2125385.1 glutamate--cysteine ligase [Yinghuangia seranimata]
MTSTLTVGVEEEFFLVDRMTRRAVPRAPEVLAWGRDMLGDRLHPEFLRTQVEAASRPASTLAALLRDLVGMRRGAAAAAAFADCRIAAGGTAVLPGSRPVPLTAGRRYRRMAERFAALVADLGDGVCGCHVHVGIPDREEAVRVANHLRPWLPTVHALTANSPFRDGGDSGYAAWRMVRWAQWPTVAPTPAFADAAAYDHAVDALVDSDTLLDRGMVYWYARLSERYPTLEIRVADTSSDVAITVLTAALIRGLCAALLDDVRADRAAPAVPDELLRAAHWRAARDGLTGKGVDPATGQLVPARRLARALLLRARPGLLASGDFDTTAGLLRAVLRHGDGALRQRVAYRRHRSPQDVVDMLATQSEAGSALADPRFAGLLGRPLEAPPVRVARVVPQTAE